MRTEPVSRVIILNNEAQVLLLKPDSSSTWHLPEMAMKLNETAAHCALRAADEQAGLHVLDMECVGYSSAKDEQIVNQSGDSIQQHVLIFVSTYWEEAATSLQTIEPPFEWFAVADLPALNENMAATITLFRSWLTNRQFVIR